MEKQSKELAAVVVTLKKSAYSLIEKYTRMAIALRRDRSLLNSFCVKIMGRVGDGGEFFVTPEMEDDFTATIIAKNIAFAKEWMEFFQTIDIFVQKLFEFKDVTYQLRKNNNIYFKRMCEYWCGDAGGRTGIEGLQLLATDIDTLAADVGIENAGDFYEKYCNEDVIDGVFRIFSREYPKADN